MILPPPIPPIPPYNFNVCKCYIYFVAECKKCDWKKMYRGDKLLIPDKCPKCKEEIRFRKANWKDMLNIIEVIKADWRP